MKLKIWKVAPIAFFVAVLALVLSPCAKAQTYGTSGTNITRNGSAWVAGGVNDFDQFGASDKGDRGVKIVRTVVDCMQFCPISSADGGRSGNVGYLRPLEDIVKDNRAQGRVTVLAMFGWNDTDVTEIKALFPSRQPWYGAYKARLKQIAAYFSGSSDVWIDPWNEPYPPDDQGFSNAEWLDDMNDIYNTIRSVNSNIILIPGQGMDGRHQVLVSSEAASFRAGKSKIVAQLHAYYEWTQWDLAYDAQRIDDVRAAGWPLIFGEVGFWNSPTDARGFLDVTVQKQVPTLAWSWQGSDGYALVNGNGSNTAWGNVFFPYLSRYGAATGAPIGKRIAVKAYNGLFVSANVNSSSFLMASWATSVGGWEQFDVVDAGNGQVALKSVATGKYVTCDLNTAENRLRADWATVIQGWEKFVWENKGSGAFALKSAAANKYVSCDGGSNDKLLKAQWATSAGGWETFSYSVQ